LTDLFDLWYLGKQAYEKQTPWTKEMLEMEELAEENLNAEPAS
jgi:hypothetical protein